MPPVPEDVIELTLYDDAITPVDALNKTQALAEP
jgi:hypothetical protein